MQFRCALAMLLLFGWSLLQFSVGEEPAHLLQKDNHCALCVSSINLGNALAATLPELAKVSPAPLEYVAARVEAVRAFPVIPRSRAPPAVL
ncbi:hypothetical protein PVT67_00935 [Gallaecimonas kandeliae]|uniref:hypothetical protein n=1 Tax=Gallaecimonas kandeliae TaxID=3029055 RepID=UPI0026498F05|nr:hypothetical protein [Gallaecimonas kandeliae]WKE65853.1 hypothetical protein PVT67_00935 [Gallaecimonas kandeliae]